MRAAPFHLEAAQQLPENLLFGTSSWIYPGWKEQVYCEDYPSDRAFRAGCLREYGRFPWFRTVGIDATYYAPPRPGQLQRWAGLLPKGFPWVSKVWQELLLPRFPQLERWKDRAGEENPRFLDPAVFRHRVLPAYREPAVAGHMGPFVLQFPRLDLTAWPPQEFLARLDDFLADLPEDLEMAVEVRNPELLAPGYFALLNRHRATHVFNHWTSMPRLLDQMLKAAAAGGLQADFYVARLLTPRGLAYAEAVRRFQPYTRVQQPIQTLRDDAVRLARRALQRGVRAFILVNNRCEGNAPGTIDALGTRIVSECAGG